MLGVTAMSAGASMMDIVVPLPGSAAAATAWRSAGRLHVTVIAKATFSLEADARASHAAPEDILRAEVHHGQDPRRSVLLTSDLAPYLGRADVLFTGAAHAPGGVPVRALPVRLAIFAGQKALVDKRLLVRDPRGFIRMPVVYERASRGDSGIDNPFGVAPGEGEPNIVDPARPDAVAGFGPVGRAWPTRKRLLGETPRRALDGPVAEIPDGFDWSYFNAAPADQRTEYLHGDEWIVLEGLHPSIPYFRTRLPGARGRARLYGLQAAGVAEGAPLDLSADTLRIDGDAQRCTLVFRQSFSVPGEAALEAARIAAGVEIEGEPLGWIDPRAAPIPRSEAPVTRGPLLVDWTLDVTGSGEPDARGPALPFIASSAAPPLTFSPVIVPPPPMLAPAASLPEPIWPAVVPAGVLAVSDAAATGQAQQGTGPDSAVPSTVQQSDAPVRVLDLLWFDARSLPRIRRHPAWRDILEGLGDQALDPDIDDPDLSADPAEAEDRREVFEVLTHGKAMSEEALRAALRGAVRRDGRFVAPLVLLEGEVSFPFDEIATLEAMVSIVSQLGGGEDALKSALAAAKDFLSSQGPLSSRTAAEKHAAAIQAAYEQGKRAAPFAEVRAQVVEALLDRRRYQRRAVFGGAMLRALLLPAGAAEAVPAYLPDSLAEALPLFPCFPARMVAEAHLPADRRDRHATALRIVAAARLGGPGAEGAVARL